MYACACIYVTFNNRAVTAIHTAFVIRLTYSTVSKVDAFFGIERDDENTHTHRYKYTVTLNVFQAEPVSRTASVLYLLSKFLRMIEDTLAEVTFTA